MSTTPHVRTPLFFTKIVYSSTPPPLCAGLVGWVVGWLVVLLAGGWAGWWLAGHGWWLAVWWLDGLAGGMHPLHFHKNEYL